MLTHEVLLCITSHSTALAEHFTLYVISYVVFYDALRTCIGMFGTRSHSIARRDMMLLHGVAWDTAVSCKVIRLLIQRMVHIMLLQDNVPSDFTGKHGIVEFASDMWPLRVQKHIS